MPQAEPLIQVRHHPLLLLRRAWRPGLLMLLAALAAVLVATDSGAPDWALYGTLLWVVLAAFLGGASWAAWLYLRWSYDTLALTEHRVVERRGIPALKEERRELRLERIQSVEVKQRSLLMRWCGCGDLVLDIAGGGPLRFAAAREVFAVRDWLVAHLAERRRAATVVDEEEVRATMRRLLDPEAPPPLLDDSPGATASRPGGVRRPRAPHFGRRFAGETWRRHPWFLARGALAPLALVAAAFGAPTLLDLFALGAPAGALILALLLLAGGRLAWVWADWRNDHYVVTPDRLIEVEQLPLGLRQRVSEAALDRVQDIRYRVPHPLARLLDYGDVAVHTAGETAPFVFRGIARPRELAAAIDRHATALRLREESARHRALRDEFAQWLIAYERLAARDRGE
jgi:uncharacterized membrane protein YdbT with pleckstrin-like domain